MVDFVNDDPLGLDVLKAPAQQATTVPYAPGYGPNGKTPLTPNGTAQPAAVAPAPAAAAAAPDPASPAAAGGMQGLMQGGLQDILKMVFMAIAQMMGMNMTAMSTAQAQIQQVPAAQVAAADNKASGQTVKPDLKVEPPKPAAAPATPAAVTAAPAVAAAEPAAKPEPEVKPEAPAATAPKTLPPLQERIEALGNRYNELMETGMPTRKESMKIVWQERREELKEQGYSQAEIQKISAEEARPFLRHLREQAREQRLGTPKPEAAASVTPAAVAAEPTQPAAKPPEVAPAAAPAQSAVQLTETQIMQMQKLASGTGGMGGPNSEADQKMIYDSLRQQAVTDPNFSSKLQALSEQRISLRVAQNTYDATPGKPGISMGSNAYEVRFDPQDLKKGVSPLDGAIDSVVSANKRNIEAVRNNAQVQGQSLSEFDQQEISRNQKTIASLEAVAQPAPVSAPKVTPQEAPVTKSTVPVAEAAAPVQVAAAPRAAEPLTQQYNAQASRTLPSLDERMQARAERIGEYVNKGLSLRDASKIVGQERVQEMQSQGYDRNTIRSIVGAENRIEAKEIKGIEAQQRAEAKADARAERDAIRNQRSADRENERDGRTLAGVAADMGGLRGSDKRLATAVGGLLGRVGGAVLGDDAPSDRGDKERGRYAKEIGGAAGGSSYGKLAEVIFRRGGDVVTYPQQQGGGTRIQSGSWDSNQITGEQQRVSSYGATAEQRQQILSAPQAETPAPASNEHRQQQPAAGGFGMGGG